MAYAERHSVTVTTDASGDATAFLPSESGKSLTGRIITIIYDKDDFANGVDFDVTMEGTGETVWDEDDVNASKTVAPRQATHDTAGAAALYADAGEAVNDYIVAANDRVKIVVASGGNAKSGTFTVVVA